MKTSFLESNVWVGVLAAMITWLGLMATDIYTPAMPAVVHALNTSANTVQLTMTWFLIAAGLSQLVYGPLSDHWGRRRLIITGIVIYTLGSLFCAMAPHISWLLLGRFIQGIGVGGIMSLNRIIIRDTFSGKQLAKALSYIGAFVALAPAIAPAIGGYIQAHSNWRWIFGLLFIFSGIMSLVCWFTLPETHKSRIMIAPSALRIGQNYLFILKNSNFWANVICAGLAFAAMISCATINPFIIEVSLGQTADVYGLLAMISASGFIIGMFVNPHLVSRLGIDRTLKIGNFLVLVMGLIFIVTATFKILTVSAIILPTIGIELGIALVFPNAFMGAIAPFSKIAGAAGAMYGFLQVGISFLTSLVVAMLGNSNQLPLGILLFAIAAIGLIVYHWLSRPPGHVNVDLATIKE